MLGYVLAIVGLGVACALWVLVHRAAERSRNQPPPGGCGTCNACEDAANDPAGESE